MKKYLSTAILASALFASTNCFAALQYNYDKNSNSYTIKSEDIIPLDEGKNLLKIAFTKEYKPNANNKSSAIIKPTYTLQLRVDGQDQYEFANMVNYWQERNYTYEETADKRAIETEQALLAKEKEQEKASAEQAKKTGESQEASPAQIAAKEQREARIAELKEAHQKYEKTKKELKRNASTLIYLEVESKLSRTDESQPLYEFPNPSFKPEAEETISENEPENLMEKELELAEKERQLKQEEEQRELLAKLNADNPEAAAELRDKLEAESKIAKANASEKKVNEDIAARSAMVEEVKATRAAFFKYQEEQKALMKDMQFTSIAKASLKEKDNFFKKVNNSLLTNTPLFLEIIFWKGGPNQRIWLQKDKLEELQQLLSYDVYKHSADLANLK